VRRREAVEHTAPVNHTRPAAVLALALVLAACGAVDGATPATGSTGPARPAERAPLPGERLEIYPYRGARLAVVGVAAGDTLNVRSGPGTDYDVVFELEPLATNVTATGHNRSVEGTGFWAEITADGRTGWAKARFLLQPGLVRDVTADLFPAPGDRPQAPTMRQLGRIVGDRVGGDEPPSDIVVVDEPGADDLAEITVDVIGFADDSVGGERLKIRAERARDGEGFVVRSVESTVLCSRGVSGDRLCT
jgi:hypothetical protein